jgi:predicted transcriptional regulator
VEVITGDDAEPNPAWLAFTKTGRARSKIRHHLKTLAQDESRHLGERMLTQALRHEGIAQLLHMSLANYAAGAIMMPYGRFLKACEEMHYSIDRLCGEFGANVEQVAHRFTTLSRPGARGVPFFIFFAMGFIFYA